MSLQSIPNIVQVYNPQNSGCSDFYYRVGSPAKSFAAKYRINWTDITSLHEDRDSLCLDADILIVNFVANPEVVHLMHKRKQLGKKTIFEVNDNFTAVPKDSPAYNFYKSKNTQSLMYQAIRLADAVIVSNPLIFDELNIKTENKMAFENFIEEINLDIKPNALNKRKPFVIGWGGSFGHYEDFKTFAPAINLLLEKHKNINVAIKGNDKFKLLIDKQFYDRLIFENFSPLLGWYKFLKKIDLGLCFINNDKFNKTRSDIKFIEYVANGVLPICSNFGPYSLIDIDEIKFNDINSLVEKIENFLEAEDKIENIFRKAQNFIKENRTKAVILEKRARFLSKIFDIKIEEGTGEYKLLDRSAIMPDLLDFLDSKIIIKKDFNHPLFYYKQHHDNLEKIKYAIDNIKNDSVLLNKRYVELLIIHKKEQQALLLLSQLIKKFPANPEFLNLMIMLLRKKKDFEKIKPLLEKLKKLLPDFS